MGSPERKQKVESVSPLPVLCIFGLFLVFLFVIGNRAPVGPEKKRSYMGVDLGVSYVRVGVYPSYDSFDRALKILPDNLTSRFSPPYVAFTEEGTLYGEEAYLQAEKNPRNTIFGVSKLIGRKFSEVQTEIANLPFKVVDKSGRPVISVDVGNRNMLFTPEEVYGMTLAKVKEVTEDYTGTMIIEAVVAVPAFFNNSQREAVKAEGTKINLEIQRTIARSTAAAIGGFWMNATEDVNNLFVFDFDESLTVHLESLDDGVSELLGSSAAIPLQDSSEARGSIPFLLDQALESMKKLLADANMEETDIKSLLVAGNSALAPDFQAGLRERLPIPVVNTTSPLDAIVTGAAVKAHEEWDSQHNIGCIVIDVNDLSFGIETADGMMATILPRNSPIPIRRSANFTTAVDNQSNVLIKVFQGERALTMHNRLVGQFELGLDPALKDVPIIEVVINHDAYYMITVTARDVRAGSTASATLSGIALSHYTMEEVDGIVSEARAHAAEDAALRELMSGPLRAIGGSPDPGVRRHGEL